MVPAAALLLLILLHPTAMILEEAEPPPAEALYFKDRSFEEDAYNLTTYPPAANDNGSRIQFDGTGSSARFSLTLDALPAPWNVTPKSLSQAAIHLSGLDELLPLPPDDPQHAQQTAGHIEIRVRVVDGAFDTVTEGAALFQPQPWDPRDEVFAFEIPLRAASERSLSPTDGTDHITISIIVSGRNKDLTNVSPVHLHMGSNETPSRIALHDFPYEAFREWEDAEIAVRQVNQNILHTGNRTTAPAPTAVSTESPETSKSVPLVHPIATVLAAIAVGRRVSTGRNGRSP